MIGYPNDRRKKRGEDGEKDRAGEAKTATIPFDFVGSFAAKDRQVQRNKQPPTTQTNRPTLFMADMDVVLTVREVGTVKTYSVQGEENYAPLLLDSGCSFHMCGNKTWFSSLKDCDGPTVEAAGHEKHKVNKRGTICFTSDINGRKTTFALTDVQYIPGFSNLLSLGVFKRKGVKIELNDAGFTLSEKGRIFAKGSDYPTNLFKLDAEVVKASAGKVSADELTKEKIDYVKLLHRRLCHPSTQYMKYLADARSIVGATKDEISAVFEKFPCVTCTKGKGHRAPFPDSTSQAAIPLELIHSDVKGPVPIQTVGGCRYWLTFMDDATRFLWTYPMRSKKDVVSITRDWMQLVENQMNLKIKRFRTDNGTEYSRLDSHLSDKGIKRETTIPHTPQQNGRAERVNRTLSEKIACMMIDAGMPPSYWAEALLQATYVINRTPNCPLEMITPYEALHGIPPNLSDLHVWVTLSSPYPSPDQRIPGKDHRLYLSGIFRDKERLKTPGREGKEGDPFTRGEVL